MISTLLLDADGVLQYPPVGWPGRILELTGCADWREIVPVEEPLMVGGDPVAAYVDGFPRRTVSASDLVAVWNDTVVDAVALDLVDAVRARGVRCYLASNQQRERAAWMRTLPLADHLDGLFFSCDLGVAKPEPGFFARILEATGAAAGETLFIDDLTANVAGARTVGLRAAHKTGARGAAALREILEEHGLL